MNGVPFATHSEELMPVAATYTSPLLLWLSVAGVLWILRRDRVLARQGLVLVLVATFCVVFFSKYTTSAVYPVALRRWVPEVYPGLCLLSAYAVQEIAERRRWRQLAWIVAAGVAVWLAFTSATYWPYREAPGTVHLVEQLAASLPADSVVLFEPVEGQSVVGWLAAPLWSFYQRHSLLLETEDSDAGALRGALEYWKDNGREVFVVAQQDPHAWWPGEFCGVRQQELVWDSSVIGQSRQFPPYIWRFRFTFSIYRWTGGETECKESAG